MLQLIFRFKFASFVYHSLGQLTETSASSSLKINSHRNISTDLNSNNKLAAECIFHKIIFIFLSQLIGNYIVGGIRELFRVFLSKIALLILETLI